MVQQVWGKLNPNERMASIGAGLSILAFLLGAVTYFGFASGISGILGVLTPIALLVVYYLKYTNATIQWPAPIPVVQFAIGALSGLGALMTLLFLVQWLGWIGFTFTWLLGPIVSIVGGAMMAWFTYREWQAYQATRPAVPPVAPPMAPPAAPPMPPVAPPPAPPTPGDPSGPGA